MYDENDDVRKYFVAFFADRIPEIFQFFGKYLGINCLIKIYLFFPYYSQKGSNLFSKIILK